jgi:hypothetical protein
MRHYLFYLWSPMPGSLHVEGLPIDKGSSGHYCDSSTKWGSPVRHWQLGVSDTVNKELLLL